MAYKHFDVFIIGSGIAGQTCAKKSTLTFSFTDSFGDETEVFTTTYTRVN